MRAQPGNGRRHHGERRRFRRDLAQFFVDAVDDAPGVEIGASALVPRFEPDEVEAIVVGGDTREQAEAGDRVEVGDAFGAREQLIDLAGHRVCPLERRGRRQLQRHQ